MERSGLPVDEALRAPRRDLAQVNDGRRHCLAKVQQRQHAIFLYWTVIAHGGRAASRLRKFLRRADERPDDLAHAAEIQSLQVRLHGWRSREDRGQPSGVDLDARVVGADEQQVGFSA